MTLNKHRDNKRYGKLQELEGGLPRTPPDTTPPHSAEAEEHVIACCLLDDGETIGRCLKEKLLSEAFYLPSNVELFRIIIDLYQANKVVNLETLAEELKTQRLLASVGGFAYLMQVTGKIPTTAHAGYFIEKVREKWILREVIKQAEGVRENCYAFTGGLEELVAPVASWFGQAMDRVRAGEETMEQKAARGYARTMQKLEGKHDTSRQIFTGMKEFDHRFGAFDVFEEDWLIGVGALTSGGKSAFTRKIIDFNLQDKDDEHGRPVTGKKGIVFLLETSIAKWLDLAACTACRLNARTLQGMPPDQKKKFKEARDVREQWIGKRLWIYDESLKIETLCARVDEHVRRHGLVDFVVVDHLHELYSTQTQKFRGNREQELGYIAKELKKIAKRLNIPFFVPVQLNRSSSKEGHRRPTKHDLRGSGEIENAFDRLLLLHTPKEDMRGAEQTDNQARVMIEIIQDKSRNGPIGHREFWFDRPFTDYIEIRDSELERKPGQPGGQKTTGGYGRA